MAVAKLTNTVQNDIHISEMKENQYGIVTKQDSYPEMVGKIVLCGYNQSVVSLENPRDDCWGFVNKMAKDVSFRVKILEKGTKIEITV